MQLATFKIFPSPDTEASVVEILETVKVLLDTQVDCLQCSLAIEPGENTAICFSEIWASRQAHDRHLRSTIFIRILEALELSTRQPVIDFYEIAPIGGMEVIEKAQRT